MDFEKELQGYKMIIKELETIKGDRLNINHIHRIEKNESIDEMARLSFLAGLNYNAITPDKLLSKFNCLSRDDMNYYSVRGLVIECRDKMARDRMYIDEYIHGDLDYVGNCPEHVSMFRPEDAVNLVKSWIPEQR